MNVTLTILLVLVAWCSVSLPCALLLCQKFSSGKPRRRSWQALERMLLPR